MNREQEALLAVIGRFSGRRIAVWGDFLLDEHLYGTTRRISREAPVLILSYRSRDYTLGGAGNSLQNLKALGAVPIPIGVIGRDEAGDEILRLLKSLKISNRYLFREPSYPTPLKTRIMAGEENTRKQQILRIDREGRVPDAPAIKDRILNALRASFPKCRALLVSDYNYFTVKEDIFGKTVPALRRFGIPIALDSRFRLLRFKGATVATPNEPEVEEALKAPLVSDPTALRRAAGSIMAKIDAPALLVTRGARGMALFEKGKRPFLIPVHGTTDIVDVTGAGDTVISVFTLAVAAGASFKQAAVLANCAGGVVVMKKGAATLSREELRQAVLT